MIETKEKELKSEIVNYERRSLEEKRASFERFSRLLMENIETEIAEKILKIISDNFEYFLSCPGSKNKHQPWEGGFIDHLEQLLRYAFKNFNQEEVDNLPEHERYTKTDLAIVIFLHDIEKVGKYTNFNIKIRNEYSMQFKSEIDAIEKLGKDWKEGVFFTTLNNGNVYVFSDKELFAERIGIKLNVKHRIALHYVHGENYGTYHKKYRRQNPLGSAVGNADRHSARNLFNQGYDINGNLKVYKGPNLEGEGVGTLDDIIILDFDKISVN